MKKGQGHIDNSRVIPVPDSDPLFSCLTSFDLFFPHLPLSICGPSFPYAGTGFANQTSADLLKELVQSDIDRDTYLTLGYHDTDSGILGRRPAERGCEGGLHSLKGHGYGVVADLGTKG